MKMKTKISLSIAFALLSQQSFASGGIKFNEMLSRSDLVIQGQVTKINYKDSIEGLPHTFVTYKINELISGETDQKEITLRFIGGKKVEGHVIRYLSVSDVPDFEQGESDILFITKNNSVICPLVSCSKGRYRDLKGIVTSENGLPLLLSTNNTYEFGLDSMVEEIANTNRAQGFSKGISAIEGESTHQVKRGSAHLDTMSFVADLKDRANQLKSKGKTAQTSFKTSDLNLEFSTPLFKAVTPKDNVSKQKEMPVITNRDKSDFDLWEEDMLKKNGGDPVIVKPKDESLLIKQDNLDARTK